MSTITAPPPTTLGWEDPGDGGDADNWKGWMSNHSGMFDLGVNDLKARMSDLLRELGEDGNASKPDMLAKYQAALSEYNMYRMLQSNSTKSLSDQSKSVIRNLA
ncbi:EscF/YscF/HrpA family type III secretion system needle major subunit [Stenotrophomonas sp. SORGH_AS_0321]|uniref:EscF/YscF/HrpA family type III secretion system needle major subunit n=1 Tax=Stenotrophomonas sp. SORGH_AS_0321 TaxID=3041787 RepID=UPI002859D6CB|nr:EscF/YscF/HrpA family type III secretion system needle major subunit [Stenotrophomonas sp. SORGH_AS_0321]MDR6092760.1 type III secretion protein F [Stenotrophomonas sp. SORGH_AS_0321]